MRLQKFRGWFNQKFGGMRVDQPFLIDSSVSVGKGK
jgi:hypothetical protein